MLDSQRRLYDMGIFNEVGVAVQNPEGDATSKKVNFQLAEARRYTFNYGLGLEVQTGQPGSSSNPQGDTGVSGRVSFDVTRLNFRGRDHTITLKTRYGNLEKLALVGYGAPRLFDSQKLTLDFTTFYQQTNDVSTFTSTRLEGSASIKQELNRATTLLYRLIYRRVSTSNLVIDPNLFPSTPEGRISCDQAGADPRNTASLSPHFPAREHQQSGHRPHPGPHAPV